MSDFKIEYEPSYGNKYRIYRKEYAFFGFAHKWRDVDSCSTLEKAEETLQELKKFPKYYSWS